LWRKEDENIKSEIVHTKSGADIYKGEDGKGGRTKLPRGRGIAVGITAGVACHTIEGLA